MFSILDWTRGPISMGGLVQTKVLTIQSIGVDQS